MHISRVTFALLTLTLSAAASSEAAAQWSVSADVGGARYWGGSRESSGERSFRPYRPTMFGIGVEHTGHIVGLGARAYYAGSSLALEGSDAVVVVKNVFDLNGIGGEVSVGVVRFGTQIRVVARSGPFVERWTMDGGPSHTVAGWNAFAGLELGGGGRLSGTLGLGGGVSTSPFTSIDLDPGFEPRTLWRREVRGGIRWTFSRTPLAQ